MIISAAALHRSATHAVDLILPQSVGFPKKISRLKAVAGETLRNSLSNFYTFQRNLYLGIYYGNLPFQSTYC
jgi:hypothetical protein